jgi:hypothetical protein
LQAQNTLNEQHYKAEERKKQAGGRRGSAERWYPERGVEAKMNGKD